MAIKPTDRHKVLEVLNTWIENDQNKYFSGTGPDSDQVETKLINWWGLPAGYHRDHAFKPVFLNSIEEAKELISGGSVTFSQSRLSLWFGSRKDATEIARTPRAGKLGIVIRESYPMLDIHVHCSVLARKWRCKSPGDRIVVRTRGPLTIYPNKVVSGLKDVEQKLKQEDLQRERQAKGLMAVA